MSLVVRSWEPERDQPAAESWSTVCPGVEVRRLPNDEPVRRIVTGRRNARVGAHFSWKLRAHVPVESRGEDRMARWLDCHPLVASYASQPETLRFAESASDAAMVRYTPDFLVHFKSGSVVRLEYKPVAKLRPPSPSVGDERAIARAKRAADLRARLRLVRETYARTGWRWALVTDEDLGAAANRDVIDEIVANGGRWLSPEDWGRVIALIGRHGVSSLAECADVIQESEHPRGAVLARVLEGAVRVPLDQPLSGDTPVRLVSVLDGGASLESPPTAPAPAG